MSVWPSNDEISTAIHEAYQEANNLAKIVGMFMNLDSLLSTTLYNFIETTNEIETKNNQETFQGEEEIMVEIAQLMEKFSNLDIRDDNDEDLNLSLQEVNLLDNLDNNSITNLSFSVLDYENLYVSLYNQRVSHQAYISKNIIHSRRQNIPNRSDLTSTLNSSIISRHVSYLTNNSYTYNQPKSRLQRWGIRQRFQQINSLLPNNNNDSSSKLIFDFAFEF